jgi:cytochrome P450
VEETNGTMARLEDVDLFDPATQQDWYPTYEVLRAEAPVFQVPGMQMYVLTRYEDIQHVVRHPELYANGAGDGSPLIADRDAQRIYEEEGWRHIVPLSTDPPVHRKYRALVDPFFTPAALEAWRSEVTSLARELVAGFAAREDVEIVADFAVPFPVTVITRMLGFPLEDMPMLKRWSDAWVMPFALGLTKEQQIHVAEEGVAFQHYINSKVQEKREAPTGDILSHLAHASFDGERPLTDQEIIHIADHLYIGGNETTTFALTAATRFLAEQPDLHRRLADDRSKVRGFVEEVLRLESPTQGLFRTALQDTTIRGITIPKGATIHLRFGAANRDEAIFPSAATLDVDRPNAARHLAFSHGEHMCPGAPLSRFELSIAVNTFLDAFDEIRLAPEVTSFRYLPGFVLRGLEELHLTFERRRA